MSQKLKFPIVGPEPIKFGSMLDSAATLGCAIKRFEKSRASAIPVVRDGVYAGFVTKERVLDRYRYLIETNPAVF